MARIIKILIVVLLITPLTACNTKKELPLPEISDGVRGDLGIDKNINEETIDDYLNRDDSVYRDMRMLIDKAKYENIGGDSYLSGFVKGFEVVPYPYLCNVDDLPQEVGSTYSGVTLFSNINGEYRQNYVESMDILESLFPKDKNIFLMCGGGGYAGMTKNLLVSLGWDENKIYNVGGYWYYEGNNNIEVKYEKDGKTKYDFDLVNYHEIVFDDLTMLHHSGTIEINVDNSIENSDFIKIESVDELQELENRGLTFPLFVYLSGCPTCADFFPIVQNFTNKNNIKMYSLDLNDVWKTSNSVTDRIKYAPSMFIYKDGKVIEYLESSNDDDYLYYKDTVKLSEWFDKNIDINLFERKDVQ